MYYNVVYLLINNGNKKNNYLRIFYFIVSNFLEILYVLYILNIIYFVLKIMLNFWLIFFFKSYRVDCFRVLEIYVRVVRNVRCIVYIFFK